MTSRLGNVIYWAACALALFWAGFSLYAETAGGHELRFGIWIIAGLGVAAMIWVIGRAIKYVMTGT